MNFHNYFSIFSMPYSYPMPIPPIQYIGMYVNPHYNPIVTQEPLPTVQQPKKQYSFDQINFSLIEQQLKKLHFQEPRHKKIHWNLEEDKILERLVQIQKLEWKDIPKHFQGRTQNMCYSRYRRISLSTKDRAWTTEDQQLVCSYVDRFGQKWKLISEKIPKFTAKQIRERYLNYLRSHINKENFTYEQDIKICEYVLNHGKHWRKMQETFANRSEGIIKGRYYGKLKEIIENAVKKQN